MTHRDGFPRLSARSAWRGDAGHRKPRATPSESLGKPPPVARANHRRASGSLADDPHRPRLSSDPPLGPTDRPRDLHGSILRTFGMSTLLSHAPVFAMGSCHRRRNAILIACNRASIRFLIVLRPMTKDPVIQDRVQKCVKPRKSNVSGLPCPCLPRSLAA